ncbi:MAG: hypothetical protein GY727_03830 [Gammaproteobacteria bacterium]|nr:hypothetical protein [Gammaproteobacteria bacterium]MCP4090517.1 hypothetical protein [Gammaproteobacteria bacterium]MCP4276618.1 hypothetical protein [Gammaproteobacteria bacterium]MCP4831368.1 hypothetical protein [Gammaproteobacteria bacterium]MCP4927912.1 hypothetical protein [Gammaproteobacteria bacterium]
MSNQLKCNGIAYLSVGVADMRIVEQLWIEQFGLEVVARRIGPDTELARLWHVAAEQFVEQLLLRTPGASAGYLHFVQFNQPGDPVRMNAASTDLGAKNIDVNCKGMPELVKNLQSAGYSFRSDIIEYDIDGIRAQEVQMPVHDDINVVFIEVLSKGFEVNFTAQGFAALTSFVVVVPDAEQEADFYKKLFGFDEILRHELSGAALEKAAALPTGTVLDLHLLGRQDNVFGRMELIEYKGIKGVNHFKRAMPPATGILRCGFNIEVLDSFLKHAEKEHLQTGPVLEVDLIFGKGRMVELVSPAGLCLQVLVEQLRMPEG